MCAFDRQEFAVYPKKWRGASAEEDIGDFIHHGGLKNLIQEGRQHSGDLRSSFGHVERFMDG
jgi:hypothetical protein